jgi:RNA polymerase sigma-70 factor (ECF subfamily)
MTDETLMEAVKNGDLSQATLLFERYHKRIFNFLGRMTMDRDLAEDLTQNVFLRLIRYRTSFKDGARFQAWIFQVARNVFADHYKANKTKAANFVRMENINDEVPDADDTTVEEREQILHKSMALLSEEQRELLILTRFQHMKYEDVAQVMDTSVANIKVKVHRAIAQLREHYFQLAKI